jgi:hypothetical protein
MSDCTSEDKKDSRISDFTYYKFGKLYTTCSWFADPSYSVIPVLEDGGAPFQNLWQSEASDFGLTIPVVKDLLVCRIEENHICQVNPCSRSMW